ncbi:MAG: MFS transporter [Nitrososphaerota archaeon]
MIVEPHGNVEVKSATEIDIFRGIDQSKFTRLIWVLSIVGALGGFLFGYDTGIIADAIVFAKVQFAMSAYVEGLSVASVTLGAAIGAGLIGYFAGGAGRKFFLIVDVALFVIFSLLLALFINTATFITWRFLLGIGIGGDSVMLVVYISKFAPVNKRGTLLYLQQLMIFTEIFIAYWIGYALTPTGDWRLMTGLGVIPAVLIVAFIVFLLFLPETSKKSLEGIGEIISTTGSER